MTIEVKTVYATSVVGGRRPENFKTVFRNYVSISKKEFLAETKVVNKNDGTRILVT